MNPPRLTDVMGTSAEPRVRRGLNKPNITATLVHHPTPLCHLVLADVTEGLKGNFGSDGRGQLTLEENNELMGRVFNEATHKALRPGLPKAASIPSSKNPRLRALEAAEMAAEAEAQSELEGRRLAYEYDAPTGTCSDDDLPLEREEMIDVMLLAYEAEGDKNLFTTDRIQKMKEVEDMFREQEHYENDFCQYDYNDDLTGFNCSKGLSPLRLYYPSKWDRCATLPFPCTNLIRRHLHTHKPLSPIAVVADG